MTPIERAVAMRALFDVNVIIALLDPDHIGHKTATEWFAENLSQGWASCPISENGAARIMASPAYPNPLPSPKFSDALETRLRPATTASGPTM